MLMEAILALGKGLLGISRLKGTFIMISYDYMYQGHVEITVLQRYSCSLCVPLIKIPPLFNWIFNAQALLKTLGS